MFFLYIYIVKIKKRESSEGVIGQMFKLAEKGRKGEKRGGGRGRIPYGIVVPD
jgi:hypothetical protein